MPDSGTNILEDFKRACAGNGAKSHQDAINCFLLSELEKAKSERKQAEIRAIALEHKVTRQIEAVGYVSSRLNRLHIEGTLLSNALQLASTNYQKILGTRASKPVWGEIALTLALTILPELKLLGRAVNLFAANPEASAAVVRAVPVLTKAARLISVEAPRNAGGLERVVSEVVKKLNSLTPEFKTVADILDNQAKDFIEAFKNPTMASLDADAESQQRLGAFFAQTQVLTRVINSVQTRLILIIQFEPIFYDHIAKYKGEDLKPFLEAEFKKNGFDDCGPIYAGLFDLYGDLILYDMLRAYARQYCAAYIGMVPYNATFDDVIDKSFDFDGFDGAQRKLIYGHFGKERWKGRPGYPCLNNSRDLIKSLGVRTISKLTDQQINLMGTFAGF